MTDGSGIPTTTPDVAARIAPGDGVIVHRRPLTVVAAAVGDPGPLAATLTAIVDDLVDGAELGFAPVAASLQQFVVEHQPAGVAAILDLAPDPIAFLFDQATAVATASVHRAEGRSGWTTVFIEGHNVGLIVGVEASSAAIPWTRLLAGTVHGSGVELNLIRASATVESSDSAATAGDRPAVPPAESVVIGARGPTGEAHDDRSAATMAELQTAAPADEPIEATTDGELADEADPPIEAGADQRTADHPIDAATDQRTADRPIDAATDQRTADHPIDAGTDQRTADHLIVAGVDQRTADHPIEPGVEDRAEDHPIDTRTDDEAADHPIDTRTDDEAADRPIEAGVGEHPDEPMVEAESDGLTTVGPRGDAEADTDATDDHLRDDSGATEPGDADADTDSDDAERVAETPYPSETLIDADLTDGVGLPDPEPVALAEPVIDLVPTIDLVDGPEGEEPRLQPQPEPEPEVATAASAAADPAPIWSWPPGAQPATDRPMPTPSPVDGPSTTDQPMAIADADDGDGSREDGTDEPPEDGRRSNRSGLAALLTQNRQRTEGDGERGEPIAGPPPMPPPPGSAPHRPPPSGRTGPDAERSSPSAPVGDVEPSSAPIAGPPPMPPPPSAPTASLSPPPSSSGSPPQPTDDAQQPIAGPPPMPPPPAPAEPGRSSGDDWPAPADWTEPG